MATEGLIGEVDDIQDHIEYVRNNLETVIMLPGCGEGSLDDLTVLDQLLQDFPNLKKVGIICSWFITGTDIASAVIKPGVENVQNNLEWKVGDYSKENAHHISLIESNGEKIVNFGGTVSDNKLLRYIDKLNALGLEVAFYPLIMVDDAEKTWRGYITGNANEVESFYEQQYKPFIMHYANLLKGKVKIFYIGSELEGLTSIKDEQNQFPFVQKLVFLLPEVSSVINLAESDKKPKDDQVEISYAANWTEYHSCHEGLRPLDAFWSHPAVGFVAIDYYMPLTNSQDKDLHNVETIKKGFESGEGQDYYTAGVKQLSFSDPDAAWKDLKNWYENEHWECDEETSWIPRSKPIILSEYGSRSVDRATDAPWLYGKDLPNNSNGGVDNKIQVITIRAFLEYMKENNFIREGFCYGYDSRGKNWQDKYADGQEYATGHWIDGKFANKKQSV